MKTVIITGTSSGIGLELVKIFDSKGFNVISLSRNNLPNSINFSENVNHIKFDITKDSNIKSLVDTLKIEYKEIHILINNTGGPAAGPIKDAKVEAFEKAFSMHLLCNQLITQAVLKHMQSCCFGRIVNIISTSVKVPINGLGVSNTIRGAVASWSKTMANELGEHGITVNNVLPGFTNTNRLTSLISKKASDQNQTEEAIAQQMLASVPAQRFGEAQEVANAIAFLCSPAAGYINGINLPVDGGRTGTL